MTSRRQCTLPSDSEFLVALISELEDESESEDEFDGWLDEDDGPRVVRSCNDVRSDRSPAALHQRSLSLDSMDALADNDFLSPESPLELSPSHSPRHAQEHASSSSSPMQLASPFHSPMQTGLALPTTTNTAQESQLAFTATPGVIVDMESNNPIDFFRLLFDERVMDLIFSETCRYASQYLEREKEHLDTHPNA